MQQVVNSDFQILQGDCRILMDGIPAGTFNGIVTDPPYGVDADSFGDQTFKLGHEYEDSEDNAILIASQILDRGYQLCKDQAHLYMFCDIRLWPKLKALAEATGWLPYATPLIWHKPNVGHAPQPGFFLRRYEAILFARKGNRTLQTSCSDVLEFSAPVNKQHAAQKPHDLLTKLLKLSFLPGEHILDPCAGSGSIFPAAKAASLRATGIEMNLSFVNQCKLVIGEL
jgi:DNA modification methylase